MKQLILLTAILLTSTVTLAEDTTTTETCANGAGTVITGAVTGHKYCKSNRQMDWWNANAWCDGMNRRLFSLDDCEYSVTGTTSCADFVGVGSVELVWTATPYGMTNAYNVYLSSGVINTYSHSTLRNVSLVYTLCY